MRVGQGFEDFLDVHDFSMQKIPRCCLTPHRSSFYYLACWYHLIKNILALRTFIKSYIVTICGKDIAGDKKFSKLL